MIPNLYLGNGCFTKHPLKYGGLGFQADVLLFPVGPFVVQQKATPISRPTRVLPDRIGTKGGFWGRVGAVVDGSSWKGTVTSFDKRSVNGKIEAW